jgi:hypothetical protein
MTDSRPTVSVCQPDDFQQDPARISFPRSPEARTPATQPLRAWVFVLFALVYLYAFPYFDALRSAAEMPRILTTQELVDHGRMYLDSRLGEMGSRNDLSSPPNGHKYANKAPGPSFFAVPAYWLCKQLHITSLRACTWAFRFGAVTLPALLFLPFFYRFTRRFSAHEGVRRTVLCAYALGSPVLVYSVLFMSHQIAGILMGLSFMAAVTVVRNEPRHPTRYAALAGLCAGLALMTDYQSFLASVFIAAYLLIKSSRKLRTLVAAALGLLPPVFVLMLYHFLAFGSPFKTGYAYGDDPHGRVAFGGMVGISARSFWNVSFLPSNGLFVLAPWTLLALVGFWAIWRKPERRRLLGAEALVCLAIMVTYFLFLSSTDWYMSRGGWCVGPRYLTSALPFVAWLSAPGFSLLYRSTVGRVLGHAAVLASAVVFVVAASTYPHWPDPMANPLYELSFRLLREGYAVHSLGTFFGLRGLWAALPLYLLTAGLLIWLLSGQGRRRATGMLVACVLAASIVVGYRFFPRNAGYAQHAYGYITATWEPRK